MIDREKVVQWLGDEELFYRDKGDLHNSKKAYEALELLKEQEPIKVERHMEETEWNVCGNCGSHVIHKWAYCPYCGKRLKWDD